MPSPASPPPATAAATSPSGRRGSQGIAFAGLVNQKRNSLDAAAAARRASFHDTKAPAGFLGSMWNSWIHGSTSSK